jgi:hypothetical protein
MQPIFDVPERQRVTNLYHHSEADDLRGSLEEVKMRASLIRSG